MLIKWVLPVVLLMLLLPDSCQDTGIEDSNSVAINQDPNVAEVRDELSVEEVEIATRSKKRKDKSKKKNKKEKKKKEQKDKKNKKKEKKDKKKKKKDKKNKDKDEKDNQTECDEKCQDEIQTCLDSHNRLRGLHQSTPNMVWDTSLAVRAQSYADKLVKMNRNSAKLILSHEKPDEGLGENLYWRDNQKVAVCAQASLAWYQEIDYYDYATAQSTNSSKAVGHFTQLVWKDSVRLGVGIATMDSRKYSDSGNIETFIVAKYSPRGNFYMVGNKLGDFTKNVAPQKDGAVVPTVEELDPSLKQACENAKGDDWCNYFLVESEQYTCYTANYEETFKSGCYKQCGYC